MFGFYRIGDLAWASVDIQARGFLVGGTAGRTTLAGEGLQHQDGHSLIAASTIPNCIAYDPTFAYEMAVIIHTGMKRMYERGESVYYYLTTMNENYPHPAMPEGIEEGIVKGLYLFKADEGRHAHKVQLMGSGAILREVIAAADLLSEDFGIGADIWSVTSFNELRRDAMSVERYNMLHPEDKPRASHLAQCMKGIKGPTVAATDYMNTYADQIRAWLPGPYIVLGTDGFGRSDTRAKLRHHFEVNRYYVTLAALKGLADSDALPVSKVSDAIRKYGIDADKPDPIRA